MGVTETTDDGFLDGRVRVRQVSQGFRSGLDAVMLAAAVPAEAGDTVLELGSGAGVASLCLAARVPGCNITAVEIDGALVSLANQNATASAISLARFIQADVLNMPEELGRCFDCVLANPPFHGPEGETSPDARRAKAVHDPGGLFRWLDLGVKRTAANGTFTVILRADRLDGALDALPKRGVTVFPLWPKPEAPAKRVLVQLRRGSRAPFTLLPGLVLHRSDGRYTPEADAVLRGAAPIAMRRRHAEARAPD